MIDGGEVKITKKITFNCSYCGRTVTDYRTYKNKFCSLICLHKSNKGRSSPNKGKKIHSIKFKKYMSERMKGIRNPMYGKKHSKKVKQFISNLNRNRKYSKEYKKRVSIRSKKLWKNKKYRENHINKLKQKWSDPVYKEKTLKKVLKGLIKRPTSFEKAIIDFNNKFNLNFTYTGNGSFLIDGKNPDFVDFKNKIIIEVFYSRFKILSFGSVDKYIDDRKKIYIGKGFVPVFLNEDEYDNYVLILNKIFNSLVEIGKYNGGELNV